MLKKPKPNLSDCALAAIAVWLASAWFDAPWAGPLAGLMSVVGHNWSVFIGMGGGVGISSLVGAMVALAPSAAVLGGSILILLWLAVNRVLRHPARSTIAVMLVAGPVLWVSRQSKAVVALGSLGGFVVVLKELGDLGRVYGDGSAQGPTSPTETGR